MTRDRNLVSTCSLWALALLSATFGAAGLTGVARSDATLVTHGDHTLDLSAAIRYRPEYWKAFTTQSDTYHGLRGRLALDYRYREGFRLRAEAQGTALFDLSDSSSGAAGLYFNNNDQDGDPASVRPNQLFAQFNPDPGSWVRVGRSYINMGTVVTYDEADWNYVKTKRLSQRLVGAVDWTHGARSNDGAAARFSAGDHVLHVFVAQPTTGVFVVDDDAYRRNKDIWYGGVDWTAPRGTLSETGELSAFALAYSDTRDPDRVSGLFGDIEVYTLGGSWLDIRPVGKGMLDVTLWGALQFGDYVDSGPASGVENRDQQALALIAEAGYRWPDVWGSPWLRGGVNWGSGDDNLDDGDRETFFNMLPTNHLYYGFADQLTLQNLLDTFLQLRLATPSKIGFDVTWHRFWLDESADFRWAGTGAFSRENLGYVRNASNGSDDVGHELDLTISYPLGKGVSLAGGYSRLWGGDAFGNDDLDFAYLQVGWKF